MRNVRIRGKHKLADKWESDVHIMVKRAGGLPVYTVKPEGKDGPLRTLHRDLLLPCGFLPVADFEQLPKQTINRPRTRKQSRMEVTDETEVADDVSESEDYWYYSPEEVSNTDLIETRFLTRPETVPSRERHLGETKHPTLSSVDKFPVPADLEEKPKTSTIEQKDRDKRRAPERKTVQWRPVEINPPKSEKPLALRDTTSNEPSSDRSNCSGWEGTSTVVDTEAEFTSELRETDPPKVRRALFGNSQGVPSDISTQEDETLPVQQSLAESPSEPNIMDEKLLAVSGLSFSDSSRDEGCSGNEPCEEVSVDRINEGTVTETSGRRATSPVIAGESESDTIPRRSQRQREQPERLQYGQLGNPLLPIVQSLFQGLNLAFADALQNHGYADTPQATPRPVYSHLGVMGHTHL